MEQHNHHCLLTFRGHDWSIAWCKKNEIGVVREFAPGCDVFSMVDTRQVDWEAYAEAAHAWDYRREQC